MVITESNPLYPDMDVSWISLEGEILNGHVLDGPTFVVREFAEVKSITLSGEYVQTSYPKISLDDYRKGSYVYVEGCDLTIDGVLIENILDSYPLRRLPLSNICDKLIIQQNGRRILERRVYETKISNNTAPIATGMTRNNYGRDMFTCYYDVGATNIYGESNLVCDALPTSGDTSKIIIMNDDTLAVMWDYTELPVTDYDSAMAWLEENPISVLFPLANPMRIYLTHDSRFSSTRRIDFTFDALSLSCL